MSGGALLEVRDLRVLLLTSRGPAQALRGLNFALGRGETLGVVGESGCGKSMLALTLMGLLPEDAQVSGSLRFEGRELLAQDENAWCRLRGDRIAMVFQEPMTALNPLHPIGRQVAEPLRLHRGLNAAAARAEALRLLEQVRLPQAVRRLEAYPHQLSGGQRQRVVIAMALACQPDLLIADEPTTALDVTLQREILQLIADLVAERRMALMLISHDLAVIARNVRRVMVMYGGLGVEQGPVGEVLHRPLHPYTRGLLAARPRLGAARGERLQTLPGRVPELVDLPRGCPFAHRCAHHAAVCDGPPDAQAVARGHEVACVRWAELTGCFNPRPQRGEFGRGYPSPK